MTWPKGLISNNLATGKETTHPVDHHRVLAAYVTVADARRALLPLASGVGVGVVDRHSAHAPPPQVTAAEPRETGRGETGNLLESRVNKWGRGPSEGATRGKLASLLLFSDAPVTCHRSESHVTCPAS